ncbi:MAG: hypothetical protein M3198_18980 [Actinomycetota bacterium]|nr:hypothetical protein [Actinomycetota bacterium]
MRRNLIAFVLSLAVTAPALVLPVASSAAAKPPLRCETIEAMTAPDNPAKQSFRYCTGYVPTPDGTSLLDTSVTLPAKGKGPFPLVVIMHGLTQSKKSYESNPEDKTEAEPQGETVEGTGGRYHYNNLWFASKGYMVLTFTTRGWHIFNSQYQMISESKCKDSKPQSVDAKNEELYPRPPTDPYPNPACYVQLAHLDYEIRDAQHLIGRLVDGSLLDVPRLKARRLQVGVTGVSYGAGQTWTLTRRNKWRSPEGRLVRMSAAAPIIGWTDLLDALAPNGRRSDSEARQALAARKAEPFGVANDYIGVFYRGVEAYGGFDTTDYLKRWKQRIDQGEPYSGALIEDVVHKLLTKRSAFFIPKKTDFDTPILTVQGFTDGIFPAIQSIKMYKRLRAERLGTAKRRYPIKMYLGDYGHSPSQSKASEFEYIARRVNEFFKFHVKRKGDRPANDVEARMTVCDGGLGDLYRATKWSQLRNGTPLIVTQTTSDGDVLVTPADDPHDNRLIPSDGGRGNINEVPDNSCRTTNTAVDEDNFATTSPISAGSFRMLGLPRVRFTASPSHEDMYVAARLWDVDPGDPQNPDDDVQTLVTRGVYRLGAAEEQQVDFQLFGNAYEFASGHLVKLELTADDSPSWRQWRNGEPGSIDISSQDGVSFTLPGADCERRVGGCELIGP